MIKIISFTKKNIKYKMMNSMVDEFTFEKNDNYDALAMKVYFF